jgi:hypothetical protein
VRHVLLVLVPRAGFPAFWMNYVVGWRHLLEFRSAGRSCRTVRLRPLSNRCRTISPH